MTDTKQPWPTEPVLMTTKERAEMTKYVNQEAAGVIWRDKLMRAYKAGFMAGKPKEEFQLHDGKLPK